MQNAQQSAPIFHIRSNFESEPKFSVGSSYKMRCYPDRTIAIVSAIWIGHWVYESAYDGKVVNTYAEHKLEELMLPTVQAGECSVIPGFTASDAVVITQKRAFKVYRNQDGTWHAREPLDVELVDFVTPSVAAHFSAIPVPVYIPSAEYEIGLCHYGHKTAFKTIKVKGDSRSKAMEEGRKLLEPNTVQHVILVAVTPNPDRIAQLDG